MSLNSGSIELVDYNMLHFFTAVAVVTVKQEMPQCESIAGSTTGRENFALQKGAMPKHRYD